MMDCRMPFSDNTFVDSSKFYIELVIRRDSWFLNHLFLKGCFSFDHFPSHCRGTKWKYTYS